MSSGRRMSHSAPFTARITTFGFALVSLWGLVPANAPRPRQKIARQIRTRLNIEFSSDRMDCKNYIPSRSVNRCELRLQYKEKGPHSTEAPLVLSFTRWLRLPKVASHPLVLVMVTVHGLLLFTR